MKRSASIDSERKREKQLDRGRERESDRAKWPFVAPRVGSVGVCGCSLSRAFTVIRAFELTIHLRPLFFLSLFLPPTLTPTRSPRPSTLYPLALSHIHSQGVLPVLVMQLSSARSLSS